MSGVSIGDGAIIATSSSVIKNLKTYSISSGNPAGEIKKRFPDDTIHRLLKIEW